MDQYCLNCGEPWDNYYVYHEMLPKYQRLFKTGKGCPCCKGEPVESGPNRDEQIRLTMINVDNTDEDPLSVIDRLF